MKNRFRMLLYALALAALLLSGCARPSRGESIPESSTPPATSEPMQPDCTDPVKSFGY